MANKNNGNRTWSFKKLLGMTAFVAIMLIAVALILQLIFKSSDFVSAIRIVGECVAYAVTIICAFIAVKNRKNPTWAILYAIAVTVIVVLLFLR